LAVHDDVDLAMTWREERMLTAGLTLHYNKVMFMLEPTEAASKLARKRVTVFEYPDGRLEIRHGDEVLPYSVFDKMRRVNQAAIVDNKQLGVALEMARLMQEAAPHHRKRNNDAPKRQSQPGNLFEVAAGPAGEREAGKVDRRTLSTPKLKRGPRLSNDELIARGLAQYAR
jgi:hypothetical protein